MTDVTIVISTDNKMEAKRLAVLLTRSPQIRVEEMSELKKENAAYVVSLQITDIYSENEEEQ
ncbi:hypothetical protein [Thiocapsa bogorovii]|uniref:hypothetical protein n=1 Tax=Thiocapsa bogorovii TaxID=521689 RepID=UPI001E5CC0E8|nr:hypothetical protein [Thiocapsa bogorovii]UHD17958.1 hypothetical protein LT988_07950 [Thiocapsa bogorovii]